MLWHSLSDNKATSLYKSVPIIPNHGRLEFNVPFQHKYSYIRDKNVRGRELSSYPVKEG